MIWGDRSVACFDFWSIEHFVSGITLGAALMFFFEKFKISKRGEYQFIYYMSVAFIVYFWEVVEHYIELGLLGDHIMFWFHGVEFWGNRIITDPLLAILGAMLYFNYSLLGRYAQLFSICWLASHIILFPHSMYLQEQLVKIFL